MTIRAQQYQLHTTRTCCTRYVYGYYIGRNPYSKFLGTGEQINRCSLYLCLISRSSLLSIGIPTKSPCRMRTLPPTTCTRDWNYCHIREYYCCSPCMCESHLLGSTNAATIGHDALCCCGLFLRALQDETPKKTAVIDNQ